MKAPDTLSSIGCMVKDSVRFPDTGGWGYAQFDYDPASDTLKPNTSVQANDAKCGYACHELRRRRTTFSPSMERGERAEDDARRLLHVSLTSRFKVPTALHV
ncbi:cytochrome P460 family protein [Sinorhizobium sp. 7-81]|nr:cytochrome P460 family protein [Sinorhizobium sp. 8-89]